MTASIANARGPSRSHPDQRKPIMTVVAELNDATVARLLTYRTNVNF
ncbi:hypothetical protein [Cryobacterium sp. TMT3-29-2]|nr:hypothetical protein [Cryobacterium sp. TMT3-29-2]